MENLEKKLKLLLAIQGHDEFYVAVPTSLDNLEGVYLQLDELEEALEKHEQSLKMILKPHPDMLRSLGDIYMWRGKLDKALENHRQSLEKFLAIHGQDKPHQTLRSRYGILEMCIVSKRC